jgi:hypothetical protein
LLVPITIRSGHIQVTATSWTQRSGPGRRHAASEHRLWRLSLPSGRGVAAAATPPAQAGTPSIGPQRLTLGRRAICSTVTRPTELPWQMPVTVMWPPTGKREVIPH